VTTFPAAMFLQKPPLRCFIWLKFGKEPKNARIKKSKPVWVVRIAQMRVQRYGVIDVEVMENHLERSFVEDWLKLGKLNRCIWQQHGMLVE
jgi:hypothetical protein